MEWLRTLPTPVGLMACYDARASHVLEGCRELGLRVPDDVALIGVDNDPIMCELACRRCRAWNRVAFGWGTRRRPCWTA